MFGAGFRTIGAEGTKGVTLISMSFSGRFLPFMGFWRTADLTWTRRAEPRPPLPRVLVTLKSLNSRVGVGSSWANSESVEISVAEFWTSEDESEEESSDGIWG